MPGDLFSMVKKVRIESDTGGDGIFKLLKSPGIDSRESIRRNRFQGIDSASLCSMAGWYDNPTPTRFLAPMDCLKIPALESRTIRKRMGGG